MMANDILIILGESPRSSLKERDILDRFAASKKYNRVRRVLFRNLASISLLLQELCEQGWIMETKWSNKETEYRLTLLGYNRYFQLKAYRDSP